MRARRGNDNEMLTKDDGTLRKTSRINLENEKIALTKGGGKRKNNKGPRRGAAGREADGGRMSRRTTKRRKGVRGK